MSIAEDLKEAIAASDKSQCQLAREANISPIQLGRFLRGQRDLRLATVDRIAAVLDLSLAPARKRRTTRR